MLHCLGNHFSCYMTVFQISPSNNQGNLMVVSSVIKNGLQNTPCAAVSAGVVVPATVIGNAINIGTQSKYTLQTIIQAYSKLSYNLSRK